MVLYKCNIGYGDGFVSKLPGGGLSMIFLVGWFCLLGPIPNIFGVFINVRKYSVYILFI